MDTANNHVIIRFSALQIFFWCSAAAFSSYMGAYMQSKGMSSSLLGIMFSVNTLCAFFGQFFFGMLSDKFRTHKRILIASMIVMGVLHFFLYKIQNWYFVILLYGLYGFLQMPFASVMDTWIIKSNREHPSIYGPIRSMGSFAFAIFNFFYGGLLDKKGYSVMLLFSTIFVIGALLILLILPDINDLPTASEIKASPFSKKNIRQLLNNRQYPPLLILLIGIGLTACPLLSMLPVVIKNVGGNVTHMGYCFFISALFQVPLMFLAPKMKRISPKIKIVAAVALYVISLVVAASAQNWILILVAAAVNGIGYGIYLPALREYVTKVAPGELVTTAQSISDAMEKSLGYMLSGLLSGFLFDNLSVSLTILIFAIVEALFLVLFLFQTRIKTNIQ